MLQMLKLNLAEQYIQNLPIGWVFWCFKGTIKLEFWVKHTILREKYLISQSTGKRLHSIFYWTIIGWYKTFCSNKM